MPGPWNDATHQRLLLVLIDPEKKPDWKWVAEIMGPGFSDEACRQKFYKLKKESERILTFPSVNDTDATPSTLTTPKPKAPKTPKTTGASEKKRKRNAAAEDSDTPSKKVKEEDSDAKAKLEDGTTNIGEA
ncbi:hypothetical protein PV10_03961 [Exophiala mesophila]|uniref:Myb-like domain-containing protein n=1 Tax=Exophiala mesophila TaxID=212818 RepID=A0A0D1ZFN3_EXOME|nr:uncharacterized protein PV10_03961 [Exophiala mesophila]KIV92689.1 hypothetical protein PV10_03961 [Exophiala mesophila]